MRKVIRFFLPKKIDLYLYEFDPENPNYKVIKSPEVKLDISKIVTPNSTMYSARIGEQIVHHSRLFSKVLLLGQFGFEKNNFVIGNCVTSEGFRGRGIYPYVLAHIAEEIMQLESKKKLLILVDPSNISSIMGIERAGFQRMARLRGKRIGPIMLRRSIEYLNFPTD